MDERDKEIQELRRENAKLKNDLTRAKLLQFELFKMVPSERLITLLHEYPESKR